MPVQISDCQVSWSAILHAISIHTALCPVGELAEYDADRLQAAANTIKIRLAEERERQKGLSDD